MTYCSSCLLEFPVKNLFCRRCGLPLNTSAKSSAAWADVFFPQSIFASQLIALLLGLGFLALQYILRSQPVALYCLPSGLLACSVIVSRSQWAARSLERLAFWLERTMRAAGKGGDFSRYVLRPAVAIGHLGTLATRGISDPFVRNGVRAGLWAVLAAASLAFAVAVIAALIYLIVLVLMLLALFFWFLAGAKSGRKRK